MADGRTCRNKGPISRFLASYPTQLHYAVPESSLEPMVFWSQNEGSQNNSSSDHPGLIPDPWVIHEEIKSLFSKVKTRNFDGLIQFWAPVTTGGRRLLTSSDQPFALTYLDPDLEKYRLSCLKYQYNIDVNRLEVEEDPMIISGAPAHAFLNHLPELVLALKVHQGCPLALSALECEVMAYFVLPICDLSQSYCVGVVECATNLSYQLLLVFNKLISALQKVGLSTFHVEVRLPYRNLRCLERVEDKIEDALMIICESHNLDLAQVWIAYEDENHVPFSSSLEGNQTKQMFMLKLTGWFAGLGFKHAATPEYYYDACDMLPLKMEEGLAGKTLQNYKSHFCRDTSNLNTIEQLVSDPEVYKYSCFTICLRSIDTDDFDYAFEFLWLQRQNHVLLLESLLLTLKRCLPSFKFASGEELGDESRILDFEASSGSEIGFFRIFRGNRLSPMVESLEEGRRPVVKECIASSETKCKTTPIPLPREDIEQQFGRTMKEAAKNLNVSLSTLKRKCKDIGISEWQGPNFVKRKVNDSYKNQSHTNEEDNGAIRGPSTINKETYLDENTLTIKAEYANDLIKFHLPISFATFVAIEMEIEKKFKLNRATYKLKYLDEDGDWILMISDQDTRDCIKSSRNSNKTAIRLRVLPFTLQICDPTPTGTYEIT